MQELSFQKLSKEIDKYTAQKERLAELFKIYKDILKVQYRYQEEIEMPLNFSAEELKDFFRKDQYVLANEVFEVDPALLKKIIMELSGIFLKNDPRASSKVEKLNNLSDLQADNLSTLVHQKGGVTPEHLDEYFQKNSIAERCDLEPEILTNLFFSALSPFYRDYSRKVSEETDFSLWSQGFCPVCGQKPMMAKLRREDNARVLECWLCHAQWVFSRLECPYCNNKDHYKLGYFFLEEEKARRVNVCEKCKSYIKTVSLKDIGRDVILDVENIYTVELDSVAQEKGYKPGQDLSLLH